MIPAEAVEAAARAAAKDEDASNWVDENEYYRNGWRNRMQVGLEAAHPSSWLSYGKHTKHSNGWKQWLVPLRPCREWVACTPGSCLPTMFSPLWPLRRETNVAKLICPVAYDHTEDLDECQVCGWGAPVEKPPAHGPKDMTTMTGPERIREAIDRLNGRYAPTRPILFTCREESE